MCCVQYTITTSIVPQPKLLLITYRSTTVVLLQHAHLLVYPNLLGLIAVESNPPTTPVSFRSRSRLDGSTLSSAILLQVIIHLPRVQCTPTGEIFSSSIKPIKDASRAALARIT